MGYYVTKTNRVIHSYFENGKRKEKWLSQSEAGLLGFRPQWSLEECRGWARQLSYSEKQQEFDRKRLRIKQQSDERAKELEAKLPQPFWSQFSQNFERTLRNPKRARTQCLAAAEIISLVGLPVDQWGWNPRVFEAAFKKKGFSRDYSQRIEKCINEFGAYLAYSTGKPYKAVSSLRGVGLKSKKKASAPLRPEVLEKAKANLDPAHYRFLLATVWFGLRPEECDQSLWEVQEIAGHKCLVVRQPKLNGKPKVIPLIFPEQIKALTLIQTEGIKRPHPKTVCRYTGCTLYGGRKGFVRLMKSRGRKLYEVSAWMGHTSVDRTRKDYEEALELVIGE